MSDIENEICSQFDQAILVLHGKLNLSQIKYFYPVAAIDTRLDQDWHLV